MDPFRRSQKSTHAHADARYRNSSFVSGASPPRKTAALTNPTPLSEDRFRSLLAQAGDYFAQAEEDKEARRLQVRDEIMATMAQYGLTTEDLR